MVADAKKTDSQTKYERDVRERVTKGPEYYRLIHEAYKGSEAARKASHKKECTCSCIWHLQQAYEQSLDVV